MLKQIITILLVQLFCKDVTAQNIFADKKTAGNFILNTASIYTDENDDTLIQIAAAFLQQDIEKVTGQKPDIIHRVIIPHQAVIIVGTLERCAFIKQLTQQKKINTTAIQNKWEAYQVQTLQKPFLNIDNAIVIAGSDRRGAAYGVFALSRQMGVSPWYWWADVPVVKKANLFVNKNIVLVDSPKVRYRGIFINDEAPAFAGWTKEKFGGVNHLAYEKVFELILRLKGNYLWPAMWGNAFNDDDPLNPVLADKYGIVMGTSHHEPMLRAQQEWKRFGKGEWNYQTNDTVLRSFWKKGIENMGTHESIVTVGMRGDGDMPMTEGTATALLEKIVTDQRKIIADVTHKPAEQTPQMWALYKEVQDYYDKGMRVPDDVTLLLCDDNWGNIRKLPKLDEKPRKGGYGIYYHFDYVGDPRNYKWLNTNNIPRVWQQMNLAYNYGAKQIWIVNVGDIKPMEYPISFFLDYAWNPEKIKAADLEKYTQQWAAAQFGSKYAKDIADILSKYTQYNSRRKPELLDDKTYSTRTYNILGNNSEADRVVNEYNTLLKRTEGIYAGIDAAYKDAFFELVLHPVKACANLNEMYLAVAKNKLLAADKDFEANKYADKVKELYIKDSLLSMQYNLQLAGGKWNHMMDQTHIGYTYWQQPLTNKMPDVLYVSAADSMPAQPRYDTTGLSAGYLVPKNSKGNIFFEKDRYVSIEAAHYTRAVTTSSTSWQVIKNIGRDGDGITLFPVAAKPLAVNKSTAHVEYDFYLYDNTPVTAQAFFSPSLNFHNDDGLKYAIAIDNEQPQIFAINKESNTQKIWAGWVADNIIIHSSAHSQLKKGRHTVKIWMINTGIVLQKLVLDLGGLQPSYLGPQETKIK